MALDKHKSVLLIGDGGTNKYLNQIMTFANKAELSNAFANSKLVRAYNLLYDLGVSSLAIMNVRRLKDYLAITDTVRQLDFTYIVPVDILLSDYYYDPGIDQNVFYLQYWLNEMNNYNQSVVLMTDKHASLYEDIDNFLEDMLPLLTDFKEHMGARACARNTIFVANNLKDYEMANVLLAAALCLTEINAYPVHAKFGDAIFDIDQADVGQADMAYFRSHTGRETTVENLLNLDPAVGPEKIVTIDRIIRYIIRELDFSQFNGRLYTEYQRLQVRKRLTAYLDLWMDWIITNYTIESVQFYETETGAGIIRNMFDIWPINSLEKCSVTVEG